MAILDPDITRAIPRAARALTVATVALLALAVGVVEPAGVEAVDPGAATDAATGRQPDTVDDPTSRAIIAAMREDSNDGDTVQIDERVVEAFITALGDPEPSVRQQAARALARVRDERALDMLATALTTDDDAEVREAAAWALGQARGRAQRAATALASALDDEDADVRQQAAWALGTSQASG